MKTKLLFLCLLMCCSQACIAQLQLADLRQLTNKAAYKDGPEELAKILGKNMRYPLGAMKAGTVGTVLGVIKISKEGEILATGTLNKADEDLKREFERAALLTNNKWTAPDDTATCYYAVIPIAFSMDGREYAPNLSPKPAYFQETVQIWGFSRPATYFEPISKTEQSYVQRAKKFVLKEKYDKAIEALEYLLNLQPLYVPYYQNLVMLNEKAGNSSEATYYRQLLQLING